MEYVDVGIIDRKDGTTMQELNKVEEVIEKTCDVTPRDGGAGMGLAYAKYYTDDQDLLDSIANCAREYLQDQIGDSSDAEGNELWYVTLG